MCFFKGLFLYFLEHLNNDSEKCLPIFARYFRKVHVNLSFQSSVLQGSRFVWSLALPVIVIAPFSVFQKMNRNANLFIYNIRQWSFFKISWEVYCVIFTMFVPCNHFLLSRFSYQLELGVDHWKYPEDDENFLAHEFVFISLMSTGFFSGA